MRLYLVLKCTNINLDMLFNDSYFRDWYTFISARMGRGSPNSSQFCKWLWMVKNRPFLRMSYKNGPLHHANKRKRAILYIN